MKKVSIYTAVSLVALALIYVGVAFFLSRAALAGTTVNGVSVAGKTADQLPQFLESEFGDAAARDITVKTANSDRDTTVSPTDAGVAPNYQATAQQIAGFTLNPVTLIDRVKARGNDQPLVIDVEDSRLEATAQTVANNLSEKPKNATLKFTDDALEVGKSADGTRVDPQEVVRGISERWLKDDSITVTDLTQQPERSTQDAQTVKDQLENGPLKDGVTLAITGDVDAGKELDITPENLVEYGSFNDKLELTFDAPKLRDAVFADNPDVGTRPTDARFEFVNGKPQVVPSKDGVSVDPDTFAKAVQDATEAKDQRADIELSSQPADFSTEDAEKVDVSDVVSEFTTPYPSSPNRDTNLRVASKAVAGTVLQPGEQFSLNDTLGPRTAAAGYKPAGVISMGQMSEDYGGGVSQVSTTLFNAAFFAGFDLDEHRAHSRYISRYPEGRESTLDYSSIDLKFTNNTDKPVVLDMYLAGGEVHARVLGVKTVDVEADASSRYAFTSPTTVQGTGASCTPQSPREGWSIKIFRTIKDAQSGEVKKKDSFVTVYRPVNRVTCG